MSSEILDIRREVDENWAILVHCAACNGNSFPTFRDNLSVPSSRVKIVIVQKNAVLKCHQFQSVGSDTYVVQTIIHERYFIFSVNETVFSVLWAKIVAEHLIICCMWLTKFCVCSQCGGSSVGLTISCYRQTWLPIPDVLPVFVANIFIKSL
jgi:hypothetical protein